MNTSSTVRWGILGAAQIARKNWKAIANSGNGVVTAVASRDLERCRRFIADCQAATPFPVAPRAMDSYQELLASPDIDAVYIPLPTGLRKEWVIRAAEAGKHVVCEKPCATSVADLEAMLHACRQNRVQFLDGVMFMHSSRLERMRAVLADGQSIGALRRIHAAFTFEQDEEFFRSNIRVQSALEPHGCLGDLGWYCIRFALWALDWQLPRQVTGRILASQKREGDSAPVPTEFSGELLFEGGVSCDFYCSFVTAIDQTVVISGTRGQLRLTDFTLPHLADELEFETTRTEPRFERCDFSVALNRRSWTVPEASDSHPTAQESRLFRHFADQVLSGKLNASWPQFTLKTQQVMEACYESALAGGRVVEVVGS